LALAFALDWLLAPGPALAQGSELLAQSYGYAVLPTIGKGAWKHGMAIFILAKGGLMYEAVIAGQKYNFKPLQK
jgi:hypothetical protein